MKVFITGATSGFGSLMVAEFLLQGDTVIASGRRLTSRPEILAPLRKNFPDLLHEIDLDVSLAEERAHAFRFCSEKFGGIDVLINNAGSGLFGALEDCSEEQMRKQMEVNFFGTALVAKDFLPLLRKSRGKIFNFSSILGYQGLPLSSLYNASKFAVEGLSEGLAYELQPHGVQVCLIEPGSFKTNFMSSLDWARKWDDPSSPYLLQSHNYRQMRQEMSNDPKYPDPQTVVRGVVRLANRRRLPLRAPFGKDARSVAILRKLVPNELYYRLTSWVFAKKFNAQKPQKT